MKAKRTLPLIALGVYMLLLIWLVIFKLEFDPANLYSYRQLILIPYSRPGAINMRVVAEEIIFNVLAFVPLGLLLSAASATISVKVLMCFIRSTSFGLVSRV